MIRYVKILLVLSVGFWGLIGTVGNLLEIPVVYGAVKDVVSMAAVPEGVGPPLRISSPLVIWAGVILIVLGKVVAMVGGLGGGAIMLKHAKASTEDFARAKKLAIAGCGAAFGLLVLSFTIIADGTFFMFYDPNYVGAGELAFRFAGSFGLITLFVAQGEAAD